MNTTPMPLLQLVGEWRDRASALRQWAAAESAAHAWEEAAQELEVALAADGERLLSIAEAAEVSGYSADHVGRLIREGKLPNAGRKHAPRVRSTDLPVKPGSPRPGMVGRSRRGYSVDGLLRDIAYSKVRRNDV